MKLQTSRNWLFALTVCAASSAAACATPPYVTATGKYAEAVSTSAGALQATGDLAGEICVEKARLTYLQAKLRVAPGGDITWSKWLENAPATAGSTMTWGAYCGEVRKASQAMGDALGVLEQYATALGALAAEASYDGADVASLANSTAALAGDTPTGGVVKALGEPLQKLSGLLVSRYVQGEIKSFAEQADPHVTKILEVAGKFVSALSSELDGLESLSGPSINMLEAAALPPEANLVAACRPDAFKPDECKLDPVRVASFMEWSRGLSSEMTRRRSVLSGLSAAITSLQSTQKKFIAASPAEHGVKELLGGVAETLTQIAKVRDALAPKKGS